MVNEESRGVVLLSHPNWVLVHLKLKIQGAIMVSFSVLFIGEAWEGPL